MKRAPTRLRIDKATLFADLGYEPHAGQREVHLCAASRRVVACGVRWGKTLCAAMEGLAAALQPADRSVGWVVAPTYDLSDRVFREIQVIALQRLQHRVVTMREAERRLIIRNMAGGQSEIRAKSADNPVSLLGEGLDWVIVDEASRLKPGIWQSHLSQRLIDKHGWALLISTPRGKGYFYDLFRRGQAGTDADWRSWNYPSWSNPLLDIQLIENERGRLPERVFSQEFGGQFVEGSGAVFRYVRDAATGEWREPEPGRRYYAGLDLARTVDFTVVTVVDDLLRIVFCDRFCRQDWSIQVQRIKAALDRYHRPDVYVDSTGAGEPVLETLRRADVPTAIPYTFTAASKAALIDNLALLLEQRRLVLPRADLWPEGIEELEAFEYSITDQGRVRTSAPGGMHDDIVISLALACWHLRPRDLPRMSGAPRLVRG